MSLRSWSWWQGQWVSDGGTGNGCTRLLLATALCHCLPHWTVQLYSVVAPDCSPQHIATVHCTVYTCTVHCHSDCVLSWQLPWCSETCHYHVMSCHVIITSLEHGWQMEKRNNKLVWAGFFPQLIMSSSKHSSKSMSVLVQKVLKVAWWAWLWSKSIMFLWRTLQLETSLQHSDSESVC